MKYEILPPLRGLGQIIRRHRRMVATMVFGSVAAGVLFVSISWLREVPMQDVRLVATAQSSWSITTKSGNSVGLLSFAANHLEIFADSLEMDVVVDGIPLDANPLPATVDSISIRSKDPFSVSAVGIGSEQSAFQNVNSGVTFTSYFSDDELSTSARPRIDISGSNAEQAPLEVVLWHGGWASGQELKRMTLTRSESTGDGGQSKTIPLIAMNKEPPLDGKDRSYFFTTDAETQLDLSVLSIRTDFDNFEGYVRIGNRTESVVPTDSMDLLFEELKIHGTGFTRGSLSIQGTAIQGSNEGANILRSRWGLRPGWVDELLVGLGISLIAGLTGFLLSEWRQRRVAQKRDSPNH